ncbi:DinB family protein [Bacillus marasmi]|uniref:DinB family protein n=1 Tax=Bacillus marasmi TaxID=1926279 RepID=UPI0011CBDC23|nr:DinB family protein [Bacillus marasmi]
MNNKIDSTEYGPYFATYVKRVPEGEIIEILSSQLKETLKLIQGLNEDQAMYRYQVGKWSVKEVIGHMTDTERIMAYRLMSIARGETASLPGFDEQSYVEHANFDQITLNELGENFKTVRESTIQLLKTLPESAWHNSGSANGTQVTVRALAYIIAGHEIHHRSIINERYISG